MAAGEVIVNPWLTVREPLGDSAFEDRNFPKDLWLGCISVLNTEVLIKLGTAFIDFQFPQLTAFKIRFGRQVQAFDFCSCGRNYLHTHFVLEVNAGIVDRDTAYQMACAAFQHLQLIPDTDSCKAFSYLANIYDMSLLEQTRML